MKLKLKKGELIKVGNQSYKVEFKQEISVKIANHRSDNDRNQGYLLDVITEINSNLATLKEKALDAGESPELSPLYWETIVIIENLKLNF